jgi:hypothetical protein
MRSIHSGQKNRKRTETRVVEFRQRMARLKRLTPLQYVCRDCSLLSRERKKNAMKMLVVICVGRSYFRIFRKAFPRSQSVSQRLLVGYCSLRTSLASLARIDVILYE